MDYNLLEQDLRLPGISAIGELPEGIESLEWLSGRRMPAPAQQPLQLGLSTNSGDEHTDVVGSLLTVFHDDLKAAMTAFGVSNIDYFPVELVHPLTHEVRRGWWLANIIGVADCIDSPRSQMKPLPSGAGMLLESFHVDSARAPKAPIFRLGEEPTLIIINAALREFLRGQDLGGVRLRHTRLYDGY